MKTAVILQAQRLYFDGVLFSVGNVVKDQLSYSGRRSASDSLYPSNGRYEYHSTPFWKHFASFYQTTDTAQDVSKKIAYGAYHMLYVCSRREGKRKCTFRRIFFENGRNRTYVVTDMCGDSTSLFQKTLRTLPLSYILILSRIFGTKCGVNESQGNHVV